LALERDVNARLLAVNRDFVEETRAQRSQGQRFHGGVEGVREHMAAVPDADLDEARMVADAVAASGIRVSGTRMKAFEQQADGMVHALDQASLEDLQIAAQDAGVSADVRESEEAARLSKGYVLLGDEKEALRGLAAGKLQERAALEAAAEELGALAAKRQCEGLVPLSCPTPFMRSIGLQPGPGALTDSGGLNAYLPVWDAQGKLWALQCIADDGCSSFVAGRGKPGCFHVVGGIDLLARAPALVLAADYASACALSHALGHATVATLGASNLRPAAEALHQRFPAKPVVIGACHDEVLDAGAVPAREAVRAAEAVGGQVMLPIFATGERSSSPGLFATFHDLARRSVLGDAGLNRQVRHAVGVALAQASGASLGEKSLSEAVGLRLSLRN
jgi:phage/plasmid primase-like uncharacterized protein